MLHMAKQIFRKLFSRVLRWSPYPRLRRHYHPKTRVVINRPVNQTGPKPKSEPEPDRTENSGPTIRVATFNAAMFSMAPAVPSSYARTVSDVTGRQSLKRRGILKNQSFSKSCNKLRVSINLPDNEISAERQRQFSGPLYADSKGKGVTRSERSILEVLKEVGADVIAMQNVRAEEEKGMQPLSELADGLGMRYVFADSWAPEYGNAILSRWPIKRWKVQRIFDDTDFRNVIKVTIDVPNLGEISIHCTHLDHLDESWRMKQINSILRSSDGPHILAGGLNSLDESDYSAERWDDIVKYYEEIGKPKPKVEVMKYLKQKQYVDAKNFAGECEAVVVVAKGQDVQGTCKYGTRVDYILASPNSPYQFVPGSYGVVSSKGTSDHHIVKVDLTVSKTDESEAMQNHAKQRVVKIDRASYKGIWRSN